MKRILVAFLCVCLCLTGCSVSLTADSVAEMNRHAAAAAAEDTKSYLILGDSIAAHYGVDEKDSYDKKLGDLLRSDGEKWVGCNWGVPGYTSSDLVTLLSKSESDPAARSIIENADLITVSVGGNNLLHYIKSIGYDGFPTGDITDWRKLLSFRGPGMDAVCTDFVADLRVIMHTIHRINPDAPVLIQNIHNVARDVQGDLKLFEKSVSPTALTDPFFRPLVDSIFANADELGYTVADTYTAFSESPAPRLLRREMIHPNADGHALIAEILYRTYRSVTDTDG